MINADDILCMEFLKKTEFTGSHAGMRYRLEKSSVKRTNDSGEEISDTVLLCTLWPEPFNFITTPAEKKQAERFTFDRDGVEDAVSWMNGILMKDKELFDAAPSTWDSYVMPEPKEG